MMEAVPNQPKTPHRTIRIPDEIWKPAMVKADLEGRKLSEVIRAWLHDYVNEG